MFSQNDTLCNAKYRFQKLARLGKGTYAIVYDAIDRQTNESVALKKYFHGSNATEGINENTLREIGLLKMCKHPNIIKMFYYDNVKFKYMSMKKYDNDLKLYMNFYYGPISVQNIRDISYQILRGLYYLHSHAIAHRDLKPQNILIHQEDDKYDVVITDMGLGRQFDILDRNGPKTNEVCTLWYRSPDVLLGYKQYYYDLDIWSAGCVIGEMLAKRPMFAGDSEIDQLYRIFKLLGTPTEQNWKGVSRLTHYNSMFPIWERKFDELYKSKQYDAELLNLIESMLIMNPLERPEIDEVLTHPFFNTVSKYVFDRYDNNCIVEVCDKWIDNVTQWDLIPIYKSLDNQMEITARMRLVLLDWLVEVIGQYHIRTCAYLRAQVIIDRYLSVCKDVKKKDFQLVGLGAICIAVKIEESCLCSVKDLVYISDDAYSPDQVAEIELKILRVIDIDVYFPIASTFLSTFVKHMKLTEEQATEIEFVLMYCTFNLELMKYHPSILCLCACLFVSNQTDLAKPDSDSDEYSSDDIVECMNKMKEWLTRGFAKNLENVEGLREWNLKINMKKYM